MLSFTSVPNQNFNNNKKKLKKRIAQRIVYDLCVVDTSFMKNTNNNNNNNSHGWRNRKFQVSV